MEPTHRRPFNEVFRVPGEVGLWQRQQHLEVRNGLPLPAMDLRLDHGEQHVAAPSVGKGLLHVPQAGVQVFNLLHEEDVVEPRNGPENRIR